MSKLRGKPAEKTHQRLKLLLIGPAGVGKTTAILQIPKVYLIDTEKGATHYDEIINQQKSHVWECNSLPDIVNEVRTLATEKHGFTTFALDTFTTAYDAEVDLMEAKWGNAFGKHIAAANKEAKRLYNLITRLDMNVIMTTHEKNEYGGDGDDRKIIGQTFDGWKKLDYLFDLVLYLKRNPKNKAQRLATVRKTRMDSFPDGEEFVWSYDNIINRFPAEMFHRQVEKAELATKKQIETLKKLMADLTDQEITKLKIDKVIKNPDEIQDLEVDRILKGTLLIEKYNDLKSGKVEAPLSAAEEKAIAEMSKELKALETDEDKPGPGKPDPKPNVPMSAERPKTTPEQQAAIDQIAQNREDMAEAERINGEHKDPLLPDDELPLEQPKDEPADDVSLEADKL